MCDYTDKFNSDFQKYWQVNQPSSQVQKYSACLYHEPSRISCLLAELQYILHILRVTFTQLVVLNMGFCQLHLPTVLSRRLQYIIVM